MSLESTHLIRDLADGESKFRQLFDSNIVAINIWDMDGRVLEANDAFLRVIGYDRDDLASGDLLWRSFCPPEALGHKLEDLVAQQENGAAVQPLEWEFIRKDGSRVPVLVGSARLKGTNQGIGFALDLTERRRTAQALRQSEAYLAEAQRLTHTGSWAFNPATFKITFWSDEMYRLFGLDPRNGPPTREQHAQTTHPDDRNLTRDTVDRAIRERTEFTQDFRKVMPDSSIRYIHTIGHPILDSNGNVAEYVGTTVDVTESRRAEQRLLVQYRVTRTLADAATVDEAMPRMLKTMCECLGWDVAAVWRIDRVAKRLRCTDIWAVPSVDIAALETAMRASALEAGSDLPGRTWVSREPECIRDVSQQPGFGRAAAAAEIHVRGAMAFPILLGGEVLGVVEGFTRDVWQVDNDLVVTMAMIGVQIGQFMKRAAADEEVRLRVGMLQNIPVAAWSLTPDGVPDVVNRVWYEYSGQTPAYVNSHPDAWMANIHPEDRERASNIVHEGIRSGSGFTMEARFLRASDGTYRWHLNRAVAVRDTEGNILRFVGTSTDVDDLRQVQEELRTTQAEFARITRVMTMGELTASIAHEVNQPLGAMVTSAASCARWLAAKPPNMDKARRSLERIVKDGRRAGAIIQRIRALMKRQTPRKEWLNVNDTVTEVIALTQYMIRKNEIALAIRLSPALPRVPGDRVQCQQVLLNLIVNAVEAMSEVDLRRRELTIVSAADGPDSVLIEVRDSGTGLDPERTGQLFEPFYTTKAEGLGIGLSVSRSIVEAHGGRLTTRPNTPYGAIFSISIPVEERMS